MLRFYCFSLILPGLYFSLFACTGITRKPSDKPLLVIDSNSIDGWEVTPSALHEMDRYRILKKNGAWVVSINESEHAGADKEFIRRSLRHLANLKAKEQITCPENSWDSMGVADKGTHMKVISEGKIVLDLIVGKMFFDENKSTYYVRPVGDKTVYTLPLYLEGSVIADPERMRQKDIVPFSIAYITEVKFLTPSGIQNTLLRDPDLGKWLINNKPAQESRVAGYLQALHALVINKFSGPPLTGAMQSLMVTAADGSMVQIRASQKNNDAWVLSSPENPGNYAEIDNPALSALFPGEEYFLIAK